MMRVSTKMKHETISLEKHPFSQRHQSRAL